MRPRGSIPDFPAAPLTLTSSPVSIPPPGRSLPPLPEVQPILEKIRKTIANCTAVGQVRRQFIGESGQNTVAEFGDLVQTLADISRQAIDCGRRC